jgi:putative phosphoribosyl transferase
MLFADRRDAGRQLAAALQHLHGQPAVVLGLPRGGVPVAAEVARALKAPLDVIVVRKLGVPFQPELGMGAVGEDDVEVTDAEVMRAAGVRSAEVAEVEERERAEVRRRAQRYRGDRPMVPLSGMVAVIVDDGIATGSTAKAACRIARALGAARVVLAVPVAPRGWQDRIDGEADELVSVATPDRFLAIGQFYDDFSQTSDAEVVAALAAAAHTLDTTKGRTGDGRDSDQTVEVLAGPTSLPGQLTVPADPGGLVVFAHGSGSSRRSPRNRQVAGVLNQAGLGTLLFDLLTGPEADDRANVFDIGLLASRLAAATTWLTSRPGLANLPVGYFGASTGAAAALVATALAGEAGDDARIAAVVSRGGRPDLAGPRLAEVRAPTLLIVGGDDEVVLGLNRLAQDELGGKSELAIVPGATHLFEEPGALDRVAELARDWFTTHFATGRAPRG